MVSWDWPVAKTTEEFEFYQNGSPKEPPIPAEICRIFFAKNVALSAKNLPVLVIFPESFGYRERTFGGYVGSPAQDVPTHECRRFAGRPWESFDFGLHERPL